MKWSTFLFEAGLVKSKSEAKRLIKQGAVTYYPRGRLPGLKLKSDVEINIREDGSAYCDWPADDVKTDYGDTEL